MLFRATLVIRPTFLLTSWTRSVTGTVCFWNAAGGEMNQKRSWPLCAATSAAPVLLSRALLMWSTLTSTSFSAPHCLTYVPSSHRS